MNEIDSNPKISTQIDDEIRNLFRAARRNATQSDMAFVENTMAVIRKEHLSLDMAVSFFPILFWVFVTLSCFLLPTSMTYLDLTIKQVWIPELTETKNLSLYIFVMAGVIYWLNDQRKNFI